MASKGSAADEFNRHRREVYAWAYRLLGHHHDALDVVQDVFLRWLRAFHGESPESARAWLRRVTLHRSIDLRRQRRSAADPAAGDPESPQAGPPLAPSDAEALRRDVAAGLAALSELQRSVLVAKVYDGMTFAQIAEELSISVSTAKTHYLRGVRAVRDRLRPRWGETP